MGYIQLDLIDLAIAVGMAAIAIAIAAWQELGLTLELSLATARTTLQLLMLGVILQVVFTWRNPLILIVVLLVMVSLAAVVARNRISRKVPGLLMLVWGAIALSTALTLLYINLLVLRQPAVWSNPQYLIPLGGMMMGNAMNAAAIAGERFVSLIEHHPLEIETYLSLGATPRQALANYRKQAIRAGTVRIVNSMMVVGLVTLPGVVTGQLLSGANPIDAAAYQMLVMFAIVLTDFIATSLLIASLGRRFFNEAAQLQQF